MRFKVVRFVYLFAMVLVTIRLFYWQVILKDDLQARAENQRLVSSQVSGKRGDILFSDGSILATTQPAYLLYAQPRMIGSSEKKDKYASRLAEELVRYDFPDLEDRDFKTKVLEYTANIYQRIEKNLFWVSLGRKVGTEFKNRLEKLGLPGLGFEQTSLRFYPEASSGAHLLGFVGADVYGDETGYFGVEGFYNGELKGKKGVLTSEKDALGLPILIGKFISVESKEGKTLVLNIDRTVQRIAEEKLKNGVEKYGAKGGSVIILEPENGNVLAMASFPNYDPQEPGKFETQIYKNPASVDGYEPGSTFKVLVMAAAINEGVVEQDTICDICSGPLTVANYQIRTWNNKYMPNLTMTDTIIHSDNTGMVFAGKKLGIDNLYSYIEKFGFGKVTGVDLQDERSPDIRLQDQWREIDLATASFGQGISVTALQIVRAVAAIANGGMLLEPHIVGKIEDGKDVLVIEPRILGRPITEETAKTITEMMVKAVDEGEAKFAKPKGFKIAGKTGTAQIPVAGHYDPSKTIASFVGFAPADDPKFVMLVRYTQPSSSIYGAETAAPTFFEIARELFLYYGIFPG